MKISDQLRTKKVRIAADPGQPYAYATAEWAQVIRRLGRMSEGPLDSLLQRTLVRAQVKSSPKFDALLAFFNALATVAKVEPTEEP